MYFDMNIGILTRINNLFVECYKHRMMKKDEKRAEKIERDMSSTTPFLSHAVNEMLEHAGFLFEFTPFIVRLKFNHNFLHQPWTLVSIFTSTL